jgi:hypothetical protein
MKSLMIHKTFSLQRNNKQSRAQDKNRNKPKYDVIGI